MSLLNQKTIKKKVSFSGIGLHTGKKVIMNLMPAEPNSGIVFRRSDVRDNNIIYPSVFNVSSASYCTRIEKDFYRRT